MIYSMKQCETIIKDVKRPWFMCNMFLLFIANTFRILVFISNSSRGHLSINWRSRIAAIFAVMPLEHVSVTSE